MIFNKMLDYPMWRLKSPFEELNLVKQRMDQILNNISDTSFYGQQAGVYPLINLTEDKENYYIRAELPGIMAEDLDIQTTANNLSISGKREIAHEKEKAKYHRKERESGSFSRLITMPKDIDSDKVTAGLKNGILMITVPKAETEIPRQIEIK